MIAPEQLGNLTATGAAAAAERLAVQRTGIVVMVCGWFYALAGRNNADWFFACSILDRIAATFAALFLVAFWGASLSQLAVQIILDAGAGLITYKLYQQDLADQAKQGK